MAAVRRRRPASPRDTREIVIIGGREVTCDEFKATAEIRMARCDALPPEYRALCNDFNLHAGDVAALMKKRRTPRQIRAMIEGRLGKPI
jgi:hypothetical protein